VIAIGTTATYVASATGGGSVIQLSVAAGDKVMVWASGFVNRNGGSLNVASLFFYPCYMDGANVITPSPGGLFRWDSTPFTTTSLFHVSGNTTFTFSGPGTYTFGACAHQVAGSDPVAARWVSVSAIRFR
jgi:hypothetical protein